MTTFEPSELKLAPGDQDPGTIGDALGRPEHMDLTDTGGSDHDLSQDEMDRVFHAAQPAIIRCITSALGDYPLDGGRVEIGLRIEKGGEVSRVRIEAPKLLLRNGFNACARTIVKALRFPESGASNVVTYPFEVK